MNPKITFSTLAPTQQKADILIVGVAEGGASTDASLGSLDAALGGGLVQLMQRAEFVGRQDQHLDVTTLGRIAARMVLLIGLGPLDKLDHARLRAQVASGLRHAAHRSTGQVAIWLPMVQEPWGYRSLAEAIRLGTYRFDRYLTGERVGKQQVQVVTILARKKVSSAARRAFEVGRAVADGVCLARDAVNEPANVMTPAMLATWATELGRKSPLIRTKIWDQKGIERLGMKLLSAVGRGSSNPPRFIQLTYAPRQRTRRRVVVLGKGLTFDSGGLCIKPTAGMNEMKSDMGGAAAVLGLMAALPSVLPNIEVHGLIAAAENMPDGASYRPGDIFGSLGGKTVEIVNTDAEGRLALADGLSYATTLQPELIIDVATLTGACVVALGKTTSGFFSTDDDWAHHFERAAKAAGESFWRLPLLPELKEQLKSDVADLKHTGERYGGAITAALFLREFVGKTPFIHCDIAGPVLAERPRGVACKGATGHPVLTLVEFLERLG